MCFVIRNPLLLSAPLRPPLRAEHDPEDQGWREKKKKCKKRERLRSFRKSQGGRREALNLKVCVFRKSGKSKSQSSQLGASPCESVVQLDRGLPSVGREGRTCEYQQRCTGCAEWERG